ncbi:MAG: SDR family oxidoreductase [Planctomycetota bacterium]
MARCLVTGGAGFIGSHLATNLVGDGWDVVVLDDLSTGKRNNLAHLGNSFTLIEGSILDDAALEKAIAGAEVVFHHAAMVSVPRSVEDPLLCHELCATGTLKVLRAAVRAGVRRVVYAASSSAYGGEVVCPIDENQPILALSPYAAGKLAGEHYCSAFAATTSLETVRLRYFNIFGARQDPSSPYSGVISIFCTKMLRGERPTIHGDGLQSRDFVPVANVVRANRLAAEKPGVSGKVFNIGCGGRINLLELVDAINRKLGTRLEPIFAPPRAGDVRDSQADIAAAQTLLGYEPFTPFETGLAECLDYYRLLTGTQDRST